MRSTKQYKLFTCVYVKSTKATHRESHAKILYLWLTMLVLVKYIFDRSGICPFAVTFRSTMSIEGKTKEEGKKRK